MLKYFQKPTVAQVVAAELEELRRELYKQDLLRDHHAAQCAAITKRIAKLTATPATNQDQSS